MILRALFLWKLATKNGLRARCPRLPATSESEFHAVPQRRRQPELVLCRTVAAAAVEVSSLFNSFSDLTKPRFHRIVLLDVPTVMSVLMKVAWKSRVQPAQYPAFARGHSACAAPEDEGEALLRTTGPARLAEPLWQSILWHHSSPVHAHASSAKMSSSGVRCMIFA